MTDKCALCKRPLGTPSEPLPGDPLSVDCGGDCWGCIGLIEAEGAGAFPPSVIQVYNEMVLGWRPWNDSVYENMLELTEAH